MTGKTLPVTGNSINEIPKTLRKITGRLTRSSPAGVLFCIYTDISTEFNLYVNCSWKFCFASCLFLFPFQQLILELRELLTTQTSNLVSLQTCSRTRYWVTPTKSCERSWPYAQSQRSCRCPFISEEFSKCSTSMSNYQWVEPPLI